jgi:3D (Asp-Asp-Asp) domain-containing protein
MPAWRAFPDQTRFEARILISDPVMNSNWESAVVVDPRTLRRLDHDNRRLRGTTRWLKRALCVSVAASMLCGGKLYSASSQLDQTEHGLKECRKSGARTNAVATALARTQEHILSATEQSPSVGTKSWGRRFTVTMYTPHDPAYGRFNNGITSTLIKADPKERIVAVDPQLIPYHSWVWIEDLGWFRAEDCGSAIKGFRLDLLTATQSEAMSFGKQQRFVLVVPAEA